MFSMFIKNHKFIVMKVFKSCALALISILLLVVLNGGIANAGPESDCHGIDPFAQAAVLVGAYTSAYYDAFFMYNWGENNIIQHSLPVADIWFFSGHGGQTWYGKNYLVAADGGHIMPEDIPDLHNQHEFPQMRFAYACACQSGDPDWWQNDLPEAFLKRGARAYMGWADLVEYGIAYEFTDWFYYYAINIGQNVQQAKASALIQVPEAQSEGNIQLFGENVNLIP